MTVLERPPVDWERHRGDKRPKILPPPGEVWRNPATGRKVAHRYYTRVTTYADAITEGYNLTAWKLRRLALGLGQRADYVRLAAAYTDHDRDRDALDELVGKALEAAGPNRADLGTALHSLTERLDRGEDLGTPPEEVLPDLAAYTAITDGTLTMLLREPRTVCDELECAGTPDTIAVVAEAPPAGEGLPVCDCPADRARIVDTKTGSVRYPGKMATQLAIYSRSDLYVPETGERVPLDVCPHWGVIVHLPVETGEAALFWLDLEHGWRGAELCGPVRQWHRAKADDILRPFATVKPVKVVDGEVTRIEPRLASVNTTAAAPLADVTELLAASIEAITASHAVGPEDLRPESAESAGPAGSLPVESEDAADLDGTDDLEETRRPGLPVAPGPDTCAHSGSRFMPPGGGLACRDCGEILIKGKAEPAVVDEGDEPDAGPTEIDVEEVTTGVESTDLTEAVATADRAEILLDLTVDAALNDTSDPLADEILACVTTRDLELLGTKRWREWQQSHRDLAVGTHAELEEREAAARPRAAAEAAITAAGTLEELAAVMAEIGDAAWMTDELRDLATGRWQSLKVRTAVRT